MYARKIGPFIAPSITKGAIISVVAQAGDESDYFPMPMRNRCDQPLPARAMTSEPHHVCAGSGLVDKHQPSGVKHALLSYPTSAGASDIGSFLLCRVQALDAMFSHGGENLLEGQIRLFGNQSQDPVRVLFQWRNTPAAPFRRRTPCLTPALAPSNYRTNAHLEDLGYLPPRRSAFNRFNRTLTQVRGIRPQHRFSSPDESISPDLPTRQRLGIPLIQCRREML